MRRTFAIQQSTRRSAETKSTGRWPSRRGSVLDWLVTGTSQERYIDNILVLVCERLRAAGIPVDRASMHIRTHHPQWLGARITWETGATEAEIRTFGYEVEDSPDYEGSPVQAINNGSREYRCKLTAEGSELTAAVLIDLKSRGFTDYVAWPLQHTLQKRHVITFCTKRRRGFSQAHLGVLADLVPALALVSEIRVKNRLARTLLETYVGPHASEQILAGATTRGSGTTLTAAIMVCDLRDFTTISDVWPRDDVIGLLNDYFDAIADPIERNGGEILKFLGDGLLAIFPFDRNDACNRLLDAIAVGRRNMRTLNERNVLSGKQALRYGVGVHVGDVMYGNIGSQSRLDFTVIGPAVNVAGRLETLTKQIGRHVLMSKAFVDASSCFDLVEPLGSHPLKGFGDPIEIYALHETQEV